MDPLFDRLGLLIRSQRGVRHANGPDSLSAEDQQAFEDLEAELARPKGAPEPERPKSQAQGTHGHQQQSRRQEGSRPAPGSQLDAQLLQAYTFLGLSPEASWDEITTAHRNLLKKHHPDRHAGHEANMKKATLHSQKIGEAFQKIKKHLGR